MCGRNAYTAVTCALSYFNLDLIVFTTNALPSLVCTKHAPQPSPIVDCGVLLIIFNYLCVGVIIHDCV